MTSNFLDNACTKIQNVAFKTSKMDQIALEYWYYGFLGRLRVDGRGFLHQKPILKKRSPEQKSRCRTCAEACHSPFNSTCCRSYWLSLNASTDAFGHLNVMVKLVKKSIFFFCGYLNIYRFPKPLICFCSINKRLDNIIEGVHGKGLSYNIIEMTMNFIRK